MTELKPCPFCGSGRSWKSICGYQVCYECRAQGPWHFLSRQEDWNTRPTEGRLRAERDRAVEALRELVGLVADYADEAGDRPPGLIEARALLAEIGE